MQLVVNWWEKFKIVLSVVRDGRRSINNQKVSSQLLLVSLIGLILSALCACAQHAEITSVGGRPIDKQKSVQVSIQAGIEYIKAGMPEAAQRHLDRAIELDPHSAEARNALALLYQQTGDVALEEQNLKKALSEDSHYSPARNNYGSFLYRQGKYKAALKQLTYAAEDIHYDKRAVSYQNMGYCAVRLNNFDLADTAFKKSLRLDSSLTQNYIELAQIAFSRQQWQSAYEYLQQFSAQQRHTPRSLWLGIRLARQLNLADDLASYELALKNIYPNSPEFQAYQQSLLPHK